MALDAINAIGALVILGRKGIPREQRVFGTVGAALLPGVVGLVVPLIIAQRTKGQTGPGPGLVAVPDLVDDDQATAVNLLNQLQLNPKISSVTSTDAQKNDVVAQDPSAGTLLSPGTTVSIVVGTGLAQPNQSVVPDVTGGSADDAKQALSTVQLQLGAVTTAVSSDAQKDEVVSQDPKSGTVVAIGSQVSVVIGSGPAAGK